MTQKITRLQLTPPEPTFENPHAQLDWIWQRYMQHYKNKKTRENQRAQLVAYKRVLTDVSGFDPRLHSDPRFYLSVHWDHFALYNAERYWRSQSLTSYTIRGYVEGLRAVMNFAAAEGWTSVKDFVVPNVRRVERETNRREAYEEHELAVVRKVIAETTQYAMRITTGYKPTGIGKDPRVGSGHANHRPGEGWKHWDNIVWYFENVLKCQPFTDERVNRKRNEYRRFRHVVHLYHGGLSAVWRRLGVTPRIDSKLVVPLAMKLAWETGLNPEAIFTLKRDCYRAAHPLTGLPYVRYYKERSTGEKDLHLALFDTDHQADLHLLPKCGPTRHLGLHMS